MQHELHNEISREMGQRVSERLRRNPELLQIARDNLARWMALNADAPSLVLCYQEWEAILDWPIDKICGLLSADEEEARRLRQNSPFAGVLPPAEIWSLKAAIRARYAKNAA